HPGEHQHHIKVDRQALGRGKPFTPFEESGTKNSGRVQGSPVDRVQDEEPDGNSPRADNAGDYSLLIQLGKFRSGASRQGRASHMGFSGSHDALLSGRLRRHTSVDCYSYGTYGPPPTTPCADVKRRM